ncbi:glycosyltransferase family 4 protein [Brevifollis gellanilyticus]|nr:glycosyltransferase family 4 protein [Brevifollis gellanilyticus]
MMIPSLQTGGAEWAFVRQANALCEQHEITAYVPYACDSAPALMSAFKSQVRVVSLPLPHAFFHRVIYKLSLLFPKVALEKRIHRAVLGLLHRLEKFQMVNPHLHSGTHIACDVFARASVPVVESDHGDYALLKKEDPSLERHRAVFARLDGVVCPSQANQQNLREMPWKAGFRQSVIPYAAPVGQVSEKTGLTKDEVFTFGLLARGVAEKGWAEALAAFRLLRSQVKMPMKMLFIGEGSEIQRLRGEVKPDEGVEIAGYQADTSEWIAKCDVGLLPSYFAAESLPNAIIEFQAQGRPMIATSVGGIPEMLESSGMTVPIDAATGRADVQALSAAMQRMVEDAAFRQSCAAGARMSFGRYLPEKCCAAYTRFFESFRVSSSES